MKEYNEKKKITIITGAGFSKASGIPTFRGKNGLWKNYNPSDLATPSAFMRDPTLVWEWYKWRIELILDAQPNSAHNILANRESKGNDVVILTQNVDDLHERAGSISVIHLHGEILKARCVKCDKDFSWTKELLASIEVIPSCTDCGSLYRPSVVWFGENLDRKILQECFTRLSLTDVLIVAGTSGLVYPVSEFPFYAKKQNKNLKIFEFNIEKTPISKIATQTIIGPVQETVPAFFHSSNLLK
ncbi:MAG: SIR2 family NAD-dependent protein deacylase [Candidatus Hodarchaeales archaeon]|jgi:NAD-dependent deacetylase